MKTRQVVLAGMLLLIHVGCREGGNAHEKTETKPPSQSAGVKSVAAVPAQDTAAPAPAKEVFPIPILDSTTASIRFESEKDGYRFVLQAKEQNARMESRCSWWTLDSLPGVKEISYLDYQESNCNDRFYKLEELTAAITWVGKDSSRIAKNYSEETLQMLSVAKNPLLFLESVKYQGRFDRFLEMPLGETIATLTFHSDDACPNQNEVNTGCEKIALPPPTVGDVHLKIKINVQEGQFEIREWP